MNSNTKVNENAISQTLVYDDCFRVTTKTELGIVNADLFLFTYPSKFTEKVIGVGMINKHLGGKSVPAAIQTKLSGFVLDGTLHLKGESMDVKDVYQNVEIAIARSPDNKGVYIAKKMAQKSP
jgi:hypothetical protein